MFNYDPKLITSTETIIGTNDPMSFFKSPTGNGRNVRVESRYEFRYDGGFIYGIKTGNGMWAVIHYNHDMKNYNLLIGDLTFEEVVVMLFVMGAAHNEWSMS